jgi:hypothetical protein
MIVVQGLFQQAANRSASGARRLRRVTCKPLFGGWRTARN